MTRHINDRPPCVIRVQQLNLAQWEAISDQDGSVSGVQDYVTAVARALDWARFHGDAVLLEPHLGDPLLLLRPYIPTGNKRELQMTATIIPFPKAFRKIRLTLVIRQHRGEFTILAIPPADPEANFIVSRHSDFISAWDEAQDHCRVEPDIFIRIINNTGRFQRTTTDVMNDVIRGAK